MIARSQFSRSDFRLNALLQLLDQPYHPHKHPLFAGERLTVVPFVFTPRRQLIFVLPRRATKQGWIPPQGGVEEGQSLRQALSVELREECRYGTHRLSPDITLLGHARSENERGEVKRLVGLFVPLQSWQEPVTNEENRKWCPVTGWDHAASLMKGASLTKRQAVASFLQEGVRVLPLFRRAWGAPPESFIITMNLRVMAEQH